MIPAATGCIYFIFIMMNEAINSSKILENHRCDLKAGRFRWLFIQ